MEYLDEVFHDIASDIEEGMKHYSPRDQKVVSDWLNRVGNDMKIEDKVRRNDYARYLRYIVQSGYELPKEISKSVYRNNHDYNEASTSKRTCPRKDVIGQLSPTTDIDGIREIIERAANNEITTTAEFIFNVAPYVQDRGVAFREILEKELNLFREIVDDTIDRRIQDEADVMTHTQNDIKQKFRSLTEAMIQRTTRIRERLLDISAKFDWATDGRNREKLSKLITRKRKEMTRDPHAIEKLIHQIFMRGQWLKKELRRLQDENENLRICLEKFRVLAAERKAQELHVPRMLGKEKKLLERELDHQRKIYRKNLEIIDALYIEHQRCVKPAEERFEA